MSSAGDEENYVVSEWSTALSGSRCSKVARGGSVRPARSSIVWRRFIEPDVGRESSVVLRLREGNECVEDEAWRAARPCTGAQLLCRKYALLGMRRSLCAVCECELSSGFFFVVRNGSGLWWENV